MRQITLLDDTQLYIHDSGDMFSDALVRDQDYYEKSILEYLADKHPQQDIILDVGANIGNHTVYFAQYLEYREIIAFEPVLDNFILLRQNVKRYPNITLRREAVGDFRGTTRMNINRTNMGACEIRPDGTESVQQIRIDDLLIREPVTLLKIDVEWCEPYVLAGAQSIINTDHPLILIEDTQTQYGDILTSLGYKLEQGWPEHRTYLYA